MYLKQLSTLALFFFAGFLYSAAQPGSTIEIKDKPEQYENRQLRSEKTGEKKLSFPKRVLQNTVTHYNYYFNANNKMNEVLERAKAAHKDDYTKLLPFYNYSLEGTAQQKGDIDSVIYKCTAGILLHDLRNDWIDNLYLLLGQAYMFRKDFDSATQTFQYLNYAYAPKDEGYDVPIGSNASATNGVFSIATNEKGRVWSKPSSRNEAFVWQARNSIEQNELSDAAGLIEILRADPNFPKRLKTELNEVLAYWFYNQKAYDSSAHYLSLALDLAENKQERARWEFLIAQMYGLAGNNEQAVKYYHKAIDHTIDPVMEVYARLNAIRISTSGNKESYIQNNINELLKMAKKDKYENYRDIIYYTAAKLELERKNNEGAKKMLQKSVETSTNNPEQKNQSFLLLADLNYDTKTYLASSMFYDSTETGLLTNDIDIKRVTDRKPALKTISNNVNKINMQDSLQRLARLPVSERDAIVKKMVRQLRKAKGLKEDVASSGGGPSGGSQKTDLFADTKGDWYFSNPSLKAKGFSEFKATWGTRPNVDNWRRQQAIDRAGGAGPGIPNIGGPNVGAVDIDPATDSSTEISFDALLARIPLTEDQLNASNLIIHDALLQNGAVFQDQLEDHLSSLETFEELLRRFPTSVKREEILFSLIYLYGKVNDPVKMEAAKQQLLREFPNSKYTEAIRQPATAATQKKTDPATKKYEDIYKLFIEGRFQQAINEKQAADSLYGKTYWTPQLLFIEAIYYIQLKQDSLAINRLSSIKNDFNGSPLAEKAATMMDVLSRRAQIEDYLTKLEVERNEDEPVKRVELNDQQVVSKPIETKTTVSETVKPGKTLPTVDSAAIKTPNIPTTTSKGFSFVPSDPQYVIVILDKVDDVYVTEVKNSFNRFNREKFYNQRIDIFNQKLDTDINFVFLGPFKNAAAAVDYVDKTKPSAPGRILPWLDQAKYSFMIISTPNLELLRQNKDLSGYKNLINQTLPGKF